MLLTFALLVPAFLPQTLGAPADSLWGDWNADGREDLLLVEDGALRLFEDDGGAGLREVTAAADLAAWSGLASVLWEDLDGDGAADLLLARPDGDGALLVGLPRGGWLLDPSSAGLDLARPLSRVTRAGTSLLLDGPDGRRLARFDAGRGWRELALERPAVVTRVDTPTDRAADPATDAPSLRAEEPSRRSTLPASVGVGGVSSSALLPPLNGICAGFVEDQATGQCLPASSLPILGTLYPLSVDWNVSSTGLVGLGTTTPTERLDVVGRVRGTQLVSSTNFGAPLVVQSGVRVDNLNADRLDGLDATAFSQLGNSIEGPEISPGAVTADRLASPLSVSGFGVAAVDATASGLSSVALRGTSSGGTGNVGVRGESTSTSGLAYGVRGLSASSSGRAVSGEATALSGANVGVYASTPSTSGVAVQAVASAANGSTIAVQGTNASTAGIGVYGLATKGGTWETYGVVGEITSELGAGVLGRIFNSNASIGPSSRGVEGHNLDIYGTGVYGRSTSTSNLAFTYGVYGENAAGGYGVFSAGSLGATGNKSFVQPHPRDASKEIRFVCLEGNESGTYFRGSGRVVAGVAVIDVPEEFRLVSEEEGLTVQLTARGPGRLWVEAIDLERLVVRGDAVDFDYLVNGFRRGYRDFEVLHENTSWIPRERGVPFGTQYPEAVRRILVENGTLNADFTPNEETAAARGWVLRDPEPVDAHAAPRARALQALDGAQRP